MKEDVDVYIKYGGGSKPGTVRRVRPLRWKKEKERLIGVDDSGEEKEYLVKRMMDVKMEIFS